MNKKVVIVICVVLIILLLIGFFVIKGKKNEKQENVVENKILTEEEFENIANETTSNKEVLEYSYTNGVLTEIVDEDGNPKQTDFVIDGLILVGNRHSYSGLDARADGTIEILARKGYKKEGINSSFYLNEYIEFYIDTKYKGAEEDVKILVTPHKTVEELQKMSFSKLEELAQNNGGFVLDYQIPDEDNFKYVGNGYVNMDYPEGKYDILFTYKGNIVYFINIDETKEPIE